MELENLLKDAALKIDISLSEIQIKQFLNYKTILLDWNEKMNLTAITEPKEVIIKHFIDSLSAFKYIDKNAKKIIDIGTGAGFPGIPLKILMPQTEFLLVDSTNKRINFLNEVCTSLGLNNIKAMHARAEEIGTKEEYREKFDYCVSRAVANLRVLSELCLPFVKVSGTFISLKGPTIFEEIKEAETAIKKLGGKINTVEEFILPDTDIIHYLVLINKNTKTVTKYPRIMSKISKNPI